MIYIILFLLVIHVALIYITYKNLHTWDNKGKDYFYLSWNWFDLFYY